jgi:hypothetical protein
MLEIKGFLGIRSGFIGAATEPKVAGSSPARCTSLNSFAERTLGVSIYVGHHGGKIPKSAELSAHGRKPRVPSYRLHRQFSTHRRHIDTAGECPRGALLMRNGNGTGRLSFRKAFFWVRLDK